MGKTGNKIKELELRIKYLENFVNRMNLALVKLENLIPANQKPTAMQSLIQYILSTIPPSEVEKIFGRR